MCKIMNFLRKAHQWFGNILNFYSFKFQLCRTKALFFKSGNLVTMQWLVSHFLSTYR